DVHQYVLGMTLPQRTSGRYQRMATLFATLAIVGALGACTTAGDASLSPTAQQSSAVVSAPPSSTAAITSTPAQPPLPVASPTRAKTPTPTATPRRTTTPRPTPTSKPTRSPTPKPSPAPTLHGVHPGAFCSQHYAYGLTSTGKLERCITKVGDV